MATASLSIFEYQGWDEQSGLPPPNRMDANAEVNLNSPPLNSNLLINFQLIN